MNAIALLKADHRTIEGLFEKLTQLEGKSRGKRSKQGLVERLVRELSIHTAIEEETFYPEVKRYVPDAASKIFEGLEEHNIVKWELFALESAGTSDERYDAKIKVLRDSVLRHVAEEENRLFPMVRDAFDKVTLNALGTLLERAKKSAPTHPHPRAPDEPPANLLFHMGSSVLDRAHDAGRTMIRAPRCADGTPREGGRPTSGRGRMGTPGAARRRGGSARADER
jgi:hemerythrin superfamily protein